MPLSFGASSVPEPNRFAVRRSYSIGDGDGDVNGYDYLKCLRRCPNTAVIAAQKPFISFSSS